MRRMLTRYDRITACRCSPVAGGTSFALEGIGMRVASCTVGLIGTFMVQIGLTGCIVPVHSSLGVANLANSCRSQMSAGIITKAGHIIERNRLDHVGTDGSGD